MQLDDSYNPTTLPPILPHNFHSLRERSLCDSKRARILHLQRPTATAPSPTMTRLFTIQKHRLYVSRRMISDQAQHLVSTETYVDSLITSMNDSITPENKSILVKRILTLSSYGKSSNAGPLGYINKMYLNYIIDLDFLIEFLPMIKLVY